MGSSLQEGRTTIRGILVKTTMTLGRDGVDAGTGNNAGSRAADGTATSFSVDGIATLE